MEIGWHSDSPFRAQEGRQFVGDEDDDEEEEEEDEDEEIDLVVRISSRRHKVY